MLLVSESNVTAAAGSSCDETRAILLDVKGHLRLHDLRQL